MQSKLYFSAISFSIAAALILAASPARAQSAAPAPGGEPCCTAPQQSPDDLIAQDLASQSLDAAEQYQMDELEREIQIAKTTKDPKRRAKAIAGIEATANEASFPVARRARAAQALQEIADLDSEAQKKDEEKLHIAAVERVAKLTEVHVPAIVAAPNVGVLRDTIQSIAAAAHEGKDDPAFVQTSSDALQKATQKVASKDLLGTPYDKVKALEEISAVSVVIHPDDSKIFADHKRAQFARFHEEAKRVNPLAARNFELEVQKSFAEFRDRACPAAFRGPKKLNDCLLSHRLHPERSADLWSVFDHYVCAFVQPSPMNPQIYLFTSIDEIRAREYCWPQSQGTSSSEPQSKSATSATPSTGPTIVKKAPVHLFVPKTK